MKRINKFTAMVLALSVLTPTAAGAAQPTGLVHVSQWAYNEVSAFTNEDLLPEALADITDYKADITRVQFAELVCSVLAKTESIVLSDNYNRIPSVFDDTQNQAAVTLDSYEIMVGTSGERIVKTEVGSDGITYVTDKEQSFFMPDDNITRQDAAAVLCRALYGVPVIKKYDGDFRYSDDDKISSYAWDSVYLMTGEGIITGTDNGGFLPDGNVTIEQAIAFCCRLYKNIMDFPEADGQGIYAAEETELQRYPNGLIETKKDGILYVKNGDKTLLKFGTDIYSRIMSAGGYITAQNLNQRTEVYSAQSGALLFEIPLPVENVDESYVYTRSRYIGESTFGLYDYLGKEILPAEYSLEEVNALIANNFAASEKVQAPSTGYIYYSDQSDGGHLYKTDTNGENKQKLSDHSCSDIYYYNGWVYYTALDENGGKSKRIYCIRADGTHEQRITPDNTDDYANAEILTTIEYYRALTGFEQYRYTLPENSTQGAPAHTENGIYFVVNTIPANQYRRLFYAEPLSDGTMSVTEVSAGITGGEHVEDIYAFGADGDAASRVVFTAYNTETASLSGYSVTGGTCARVTGDHRIHTIFASTDPDRLCFETQPENILTGSFDFYTVKLDGTDIRHIGSATWFELSKGDLTDGTSDWLTPQIKFDGFESDLFSVYKKRGNMYREKGGETTVIYPNKGMIGAAEPVFLGFDNHSHLYKLDAEGRIEDITKTDTNDAIIVQNGTNYGAKIKNKIV